MKFRIGAISVIGGLFLITSVYAGGDTAGSNPADAAPGAPAGAAVEGTPPGGDAGNGGPAQTNRPQSPNPGDAAMQDGAAGGAKGQGKKQAGWPGVAGVQQIQQKLKDQGYDAGNVDGKFGPKTKDALKKFQEAKGIKPTGQPDRKTMAALGVQGGGFPQQNARPGNGQTAPTPGSDMGGGSSSGAGAGGAMDQRPNTQGPGSEPQNSGGAAQPEAGAGASEPQNSDAAGAPK